MLKIVRFIKFIKELSSRKTDYPRVINFDITSKCNLNCEHCYWKKTYDSTKELTDSDWEEIFLKHKELGAGSVFLTGGEPTLRLGVIESAKRIFNSITVVSNGIIKIPETIQSRIFISIDGPEDMHNKIRGAKVFSRIMENIKNDKRVILTPTLSTTNYKYIDELVSIAKDAKVEGITFSTYTSHDKEGDPYLLRGEQLDWTINKLKEVLRKNKSIVFLTPRIINLFKTKKHVKHCYMKDRKNIISYDANMNKKEPCVLGKGVDCSTCGCIVPLVHCAITRMDLKALFLLDRIYPARYYD